MIQINNWLGTNLTVRINDSSDTNIFNVPPGTHLVELFGSSPNMTLYAGTNLVPDTTLRPTTNEILDVVIYQSGATRYVLANKTAIPGVVLPPDTSTPDFWEGFGLVSLIAFPVLAFVQVRKILRVSTD